MSPVSNFSTIGVVFLCVPPGCSLAGPILGILACLLGSESCIKLQSAFNCAASLVAYPLTLIAMLLRRSDPFYISIVAVLWLNKITLSFFGGKMRQHWRNPNFSKNSSKLKAELKLLQKSESEAQIGIRPGMMAKEKAYSMANSRIPPTCLTQTTPTNSTKAML